LSVLPALQDYLFSVTVLILRFKRFTVAVTANAFNQLEVNIPPVLIAGATATQNSPFSLEVVVTITSYCSYPRRDGQAELAFVAVYLMRQFTCLKAVTHPSTNRAQCRATAFIETNALLLH